MNKQIKFSNTASIDALLNVPPLQVIAGADQSKGIIVFSNTVAPSGSALTGLIVSVSK
jgi:hypothetical protein